MKGTFILGVALILIGAAILGYRQFSYKTRETVLEVGSLKATAERTKTVPVSPIIGWTLIGGGACVLVVGARLKT
jgi:hypothetical protein